MSVSPNYVLSRATQHFATLYTGFIWAERFRWFWAQVAICALLDFIFDENEGIQRTLDGYEAAQRLLAQWETWDA